MKKLYLKTDQSVNSSFVLKACFTLFICIMISGLSNVNAQSVLFDFNNALIHSSLPIDQTESGITAHLSSTGDGFSTQDYIGNNFVPSGFSGIFISPNGINPSDLIISFDQAISDFSIMCSLNELACDASCTMRITAYLNSNMVGTKTQASNYPGTWTVDTLVYNHTQGFDKVVIHWEKAGTQCSDYGPNFAADNMKVEPLKPTSIRNHNLNIEKLIIPNPLTQSSLISFSIPQSEYINISVYDLTGRLTNEAFAGYLSRGEHQIKLDVNDESIRSGLYILKLNGENFSRSYKIVIEK